MIDRPWFELYLSVSDCRHELRCNGIPISFDNAGLPLQASFPLNHSLRTGDNTLELLLPDDPQALPQSAAAIVELRLSREGSQRGLLTVSRLCWRRDRLDVGDPLAGSSRPGHYTAEDGLIANPDGEFRVGPVQSSDRAPGRGLHLRQIISFAPGLPAWAYQHASSLDLWTMDERRRRAIHASLFEQIRILHRHLRRGRPEAVADLCEERSRELDQAFYRPAGTTRRRLLAALADAVHDHHQALLPVGPDILAMDPWPNNTLVRLVRSDFSPAIAFVWRDPPMARSFDFVFRRQGRDWVVCR